MGELADLQTLLVEITEGVAWVTLNRPEVHNAFNTAMARELRSVWRAFRSTDAVRAIVLTGAGEKAFCTGIDRTETFSAAPATTDAPATTAAPAAAAERVVGSGSTPFHFDDPGDYLGPKSCDLWKPVIAAVNGMACGGALYMLGEVDIIVAAEHATFFDPHVTYGMAASFESMHLLQKVPLGEVLRVQLLGAHERMSAVRAHQVGLVSEVVPADRLREAADWVARTIAAAPALAVQATVRATWAAHDLGRRDALALGYAYVGLGTSRESIDEGQRAFASGERVAWRLR
ncbi:MAG: enoyl-CoA hydratase/isomerase family protein [Mycobacteriales bacterium]